MLTSHFHTLSIKMAPFRWELVEELPVTSDARAVRCPQVPDASARAPPSCRDRSQPKNAHSPGRGQNMAIREFHTAFTSRQEKGRLFDALRRVSRLERQALVPIGPEPGWPEWPPMTPEDPGMEPA